MGRSERDRELQALDAAEHERVLPELGERVEQAGEPAVELGRLGQRLDAELERVGQHGRRRRQGADAGLQLAEEARRCCAGTGAGGGTRSMPASSVGGPSEMNSCRNGATSARAPKVVARLPNRAAWVSAAGATWPAASPSSPKKRASLVCWIGQVGRHGLEVLQQRPDLPDQRVQILATSREPGTEAVQRPLRAKRGPGRRTC